MHCQKHLPDIEKAPLLTKDELLADEPFQISGTTGTQKLLSRIVFFNILRHISGYTSMKSAEIF